MTTTGRAGVAVVVTQRVRPGLEAEYQEWQAEVDRAAESCAGFLETESLDRREDDVERSVVYRFDSTSRLQAWLDSSSRHALMSRGDHLFDQPPAQHVLLDRDDDPVTVVVTHRVPAGKEADFVSWQQRITEVEQTFPGFRGSDLLAPVPGIQPEWAVVTTFDSAADLETWQASPRRQALLDEGQAFRDFQVRRIASPYGSWFGRGRSAADEEAPDWKTALSVLVGLYPTVVLLTLGLGKIWPGAPLWASLLVGNILSVSALTWLVMPNVTRLLRFWLEPGPNASRRTDMTGLVVSVGFLTLAAVVFWLATTVIWTLP
jgi:antibiotic biosynthesis monooxygenase (ABM) superfamily enzyme